MTVTDRLQKKFDATRTCDNSRCEFLKSLGLHPDFAEACENMFRECRVKVRELPGLEWILREQNSYVENWIKNSKIKWQLSRYKSAMKYSA